MTSSNDEITNLLKTSSAYDSSIAPKLEANIDAQVQGSTEYSFDANRTLLKLYQFFPKIYNEKYVSLALFLALQEFPSTDFNALMCLTPEKVQGQEPCASLIRCADLLETCQFSQFWQSVSQISSDANSDLSKVISTKSAESKFRGGILKLLALTYTTAPLAVVLSSLKLESSFALTDFLNEKGNEDCQKIVKAVKEGECVDFVLTKDNTKRTNVFKDGVGFDAIASIINVSTQ